MLDRIGIWGVWRPGQYFKPFVLFLKLFLNSFSSVVGSIVLQGEAKAVSEVRFYLAVGFYSTTMF